MKRDWLNRLFKRGNGVNLMRAECESGAPLIELKKIVKSFEVEAGTFYALRGLDLSEALTTSGMPRPTSGMPRPGS